MKFIKRNAGFILVGIITWSGLMYGGYVLFKMITTGQPL